MKRIELTQEELRIITEVPAAIFSLVDMHEFYAVMAVEIEPGYHTKRAKELRKYAHDLHAMLMHTEQRPPPFDE